MRDYENETYKWQIYRGAGWNYLSYQEMRKLHRELPLKCKLMLEMPTRPRHYDRDITMLLGLSICCWGGLTGIKGSWVKDFSDDYDFEIKAELLRSLRTFDPTKGDWMSRVKWARISAKRNLARRVMRERAVDAEIEALINEQNDTAFDPWNETQTEEAYED